MEEPEAVVISLSLPGLREVEQQGAVEQPFSRVVLLPVQMVTGDFPHSQAEPVPEQVLAVPQVLSAVLAAQELLGTAERQLSRAVQPFPRMGQAERLPLRVGWEPEPVRVG